jgi:hypothetical protein
MFFRALLLLVLGTALAHAQQVNPRPCDNTTVATGGTAVVVISGIANGYYIYNPLTTTDQGLGTVEALYVDTTTTSTTTGSGTNTSLAAGQPFYGIPGSKVSVSVNAATSGHKFTCVRW